MDRSEGGLFSIFSKIRINKVLYKNERDLIKFYHACFILRL